jgi:CHAT domain-containing protein/Tfp pilus assembly protein PilF
MTYYRSCFVRWARPKIILACLALALPAVPRASGQVPAASNPSPRLSAQQQERLKHRDQLAEQAAQLRSQGKLPESIRAVETMLNIEREVLGETSEEAIGSLELLGDLHRGREDWAAAREVRNRVLDLRTRRLPKDHWQVVDARWELDNIDTLAKLGDRDRRRLKEADRLYQQFEELYAQGKYTEATGRARQTLTIREALLGACHPDVARSLNALGRLCFSQGNDGEAREYFRRALEMNQALYPRERFPQGHPRLASSMNDLAAVLETQGDYGAAREIFQRVLEMCLALYPTKQYPHGHPDLAADLNNMGSLLQDQGNYSEARGYLQRALEIYQALYPETRYPHGHPDLAANLDNIGTLLQDQGNYGEARGYLQRSVEMYEVLYPQKQNPQGHPDLALSLNNMGYFFWRQGKYAEARKYLQRALEMEESLYPRAQYPKGHPHLAHFFSNMGLLLKKQGNYGEARLYHQRALEMSQTLYPKEQYPHGHPSLASKLLEMGDLLWRQGDYALARGYLRRALEMDQALYPKEQYPQGHPALALGLSSWGHLLTSEGRHAEAWPSAIEAADICDDLAEVFLAASSEAEALDYLARLPGLRDGLISISLHLPESSEAAYARVWHGKAAIARTLQRRQAFLFDLAKSDPATRQTIEAWQESRRRLARLLRAPSSSDRLKELQGLSRDKERLERQLAEALPEFARQQRLNQSPHSRLLQALPERMVVLDLVQFNRLEQDPQVKGVNGERSTASYVGFVLSRGRPVERVDLGLARPIDEAVAEWRKSIVARQRSAAGETLRRRVWEPLAQHIPSQTTTVIIAPDGSLTAIPWEALPGDRPGTVLLEQYAIALVPHAPLLLDRLTAPARSRNDAGVVLALGGVAYGQTAKPVDDEKTKLELLAVRQAETQRGSGETWTELPGTREELETVIHLARAQGVVRLEGTAASTAGLLRALPQARWAHIATHGFFADPAVPSVLRPDPKLFARSGSDRAAPGARNPLVLSGLVLAGANRPSADIGETTHDDLGILTAEAIAALPLQDLELVVLSACETGLGTVAGGEGVFGLQRAFHLAGARTVVASLWKVDDIATRKLMRLFYSNLWERSVPAALALRQAQLTVLSEAVGSGDHPYYWAGWVLSGDPGIR